MSNAEAEDIAQEVAVRALRTRVAFDGVDDLMPWVCVVGWRIHLGQLRKERTRPETELVDDVPSLESVEDAAAARLRIAEVGEAMEQLSPRDRGVLLDLVNGRVSSTSTAAAREAVIRHRARARLAKLVGGVGAVVGWIAQHARRVTGFGAACALAATVLLLPAPSQQGSRMAREGALRFSVQLPPSSATEPTEIPHTQAELRRGMASVRRATSARVATPVPTVILQIGPSGTPVVQVAERPRTASDHLLCTGSFILLPDVCVL